MRTLTVGNDTFSNGRRLIGSERNPMENTLASLFGLNTLSRYPFFEVSVQKPHLGAPQFHEGDASFLDETPDEPFGTAQAIRRSFHVQERSIIPRTNGRIAKS